MSREQINSIQQSDSSTPKTGSEREPKRSAVVGWVVFCGVLAVLTALVAVLAGPGASALGWRVSGGSPTPTAGAVQQLQPGTGHGSGPVGAPAERTPSPVDGAAVQAAVASATGQAPGRYAAALASLDGDGVSIDMGGRTPMIPASSLKVMTSVAVLNALGPSHRFTTKVVRNPDGSFVLVGGGDPLLGSTATSHPYAKDVTTATLEALAEPTMRVAAEQGGEIRLGFDDSLFAGAVWHPDWATEDRTYAAPVSALVVDGAATTRDTSSPSAETARIFAERLRSQGFIVAEQGPVISSGGEVVAETSSAPVAAMVRECLTHSDNFIAEMLLRQLAIASGQQASFSGGAAALTAELEKMGLWQPGMAIVDGSGLSMNNRLTPASLVSALQKGAREPRLSSLLVGLPVGCATGTLADRFAADVARPACGQVRAKTGTLNSVSALAGYTPTSDGSLVAFALMGNELPSDVDVRGWFDHVAAKLAECRCSA